MKAVNLRSLLDAKADLDEWNFKKYIGEFGINPHIRDSELEDLKSLVEACFGRTKQFSIFNGFYVGFEINQIGKEFDLLRIGTNSVINIELKRESTEEKITKQLVQNEYYLKFLNLKQSHFTYVSSTKKLYALTAGDHIEEVDFGMLIEALQAQILNHIEDLHDLFDPTNYLVSPMFATEAFMGDEYFLTTQQVTFKKEIMNRRPTEAPVFITLEGGSGTGKTLLVYDIAKDYMKINQKVLLFQCGNITDGHRKLRDLYHWSIEPIDYFPLSDRTHRRLDFSAYDVIIFDEAQFLTEEQLSTFLELTQRCKIQCIFSYNRLQFLTATESQHDIPAYLEEHVNAHKFELKTIIRCSKEIHAFINNLLDLSRRSLKQVYSNISVHYFSSSKATTSYLQYLEEEGWKVIDCTSSNPFSVINADAQHPHGVVGQEYDHVAVVLDDGYYYKENQQLSAKGAGMNHHDVQIKMLYQNVTKARKKLHLVIINNPKILAEIFHILNGA